MEGASARVIVCSVFVIVGIGVLVWDMIILKKRKKDADYHDAIVSVMTKYSHITLCGYLAVMAVGRLQKKEMSEVCYDIYRNKNDSDSYLFIIKRLDDEPESLDLDDFEFVDTATAQNYQEIAVKVVPPR